APRSGVRRHRQRKGAGRQPLEPCWGGGRGDMFAPCPGCSGDPQLTPGKTMKRTVLALALAAAMPAVAQAQTNITLNGSIDVAIESLNDDANGGQSDVKVSNGVWAGSRLAVVGSEDLGGGLKGIFNI